MKTLSAVLISLEGTLLPPKGGAKNLHQLLRVRRYFDLSTQGLVPPLVITTERNRSYVEDFLRDIGIPSSFPHIIEGGAALYYADLNCTIDNPQNEGFKDIRAVIVGIAGDVAQRNGCILDCEKKAIVTLYPGAFQEIDHLSHVCRKALIDFDSQIEISTSSSSVDITAKGINKGSGLLFWSQKTGIKPDTILVIGNGENDLSMFLHAEYIACPGNATLKVKNAVRRRDERGFVAHAHETTGVVQTLGHFFGVDLPDPRLISLATVAAARQKKDLMCAKIPTTHLMVSRGAVRIEIPDEPQVAIDREGFRALVEPSHGEFFRWGAGGLAPILSTKDGEFLVTIHRDADAASWPNTLTVPTGLTADETEFVSIIHAMVREGIEEILIKTPKGLFAPSFRTMLQKTVNGILPVSLKFARHFWPGIKTLDRRWASFVRLRQEVNLEVAWGAKHSSLNCIVTIHPETNGIDAVKVVRYDVPYHLHDISIADGEETRKGEPLNRSIYLISLDEVFRWTVEGGDVHAAQSFISGKEQGEKTLTGIKPLPFLRDVMFALAE